MIRISHILPSFSLGLLAVLAPANAQDDPGKDAESATISFEKQVKPILEAACVRCHNEDEAEGDLLLDTRANAIIGGENGAALVPGKPEDSLLYTTTMLPEDDDLSMPPKGKFLAKSQIEIIGKWITEGAEWPDEVTLEKESRMMFVRDIQPILEENCVTCHKADKAEGDFDMTTRKMAFTSGENAPSIVPFDAEASAIYFLTTLDEDDDELMPPVKKGGPLPKTITEKLRLWVSQGAPWPEGVELKQRAKIEDNE
ncbi:MAG: mono/diheme cytochrome c family protein, partial [Verrucomicrobiales bacterium]